MVEETGLSARELVPLGHFYPSPGVFDEVIHLFFGTGLSQGNAEPELYEEIATVRNCRSGKRFASRIGEIRTARRSRRCCGR